MKDVLKVRVGKQSPFKLTFAVTYNCNSKCSTCDIWKKKPEQELDIDEITAFFKKNKFRWVNLTGGEVFLRQDLIDIIKSIPKLEILSITTNGMLTNKIIEDVKEILNHTNTLTMTISIDGPEEIHNKIRGIESWKLAVETLKQLKQIEKENNKLKVFVGYTISPDNVGMVEKTYQAIKNHVPGLELEDFHVNIYHTSEVYYGNKHVNIKSEDIMKDVNAVLEKKKGLNAVSVLERRYMKHIQKYLETGKSPVACKALSASIFMDPKGNIYPCTMMNENLGNIRDFDFSLKYLFSQSKAKKALVKIKSGQCPGCWTACEAYQTILGNLGSFRKR